MVEFLLVPAAGLVLAALLAVQFLAGGVTYGPRARRILALLTGPAAALGAIGALTVSSRALWLRTTIGSVAGLSGYLLMATVAVYRLRDRKVAALIGDLRAVRRRLADRQREVERLLWSARSAMPPSEPLPAAGAEDWGSLLQQWLGAEPAQVERRRSQLAGWEAEFRRDGHAALAARSRVLEAGWREAPEGPERLARGARLAALWLVLRSMGPPESDPIAGASMSRNRLAVARQELARLQEELDHLLQQRGALLRRRLPLD